MSTTAPTQVDPSSFDTSGISVATSTPNANPRAGAIYDPVTFAAAAPVWFHPMAAGGHLMVSSRSWNAATPVGGLPGVYSSHSESLEPSWCVVRGPTGQRAVVQGFPGGIPTNIVTESRVLVGGASRGSDYLYLLHAAVINGAPAAVLQHIRIAPNGTASIYGEEVVPTAIVDGEVMVFDKGLQHQPPYLHLYGTDEAGNVYRVRRSWAQVGINRNLALSERGWEYFTGTGFSLDPVLIASVKILTTAGPMSFAAFRHIMVATTVTGTPPDYSGQFWHSSSGRPWKRVGVPVPLGSGDTYLGGGIRLMDSLAANPAHVITSAGIPYVISTKATVDEGDSLVNTWGLHPITL